MEFQNVVRRRRMVRNFDDRPIAVDVVERILDNARRAPSAGFSQATELLVLEGDEETERFWAVNLEAARRPGFPWPGLLRAPLLIVSFAHKKAYLDRYAEQDKGWTDRDERRWPAPYWYIDAAFSTMVILLSVVDSGLGALFFSVARPDGVRREFGVPSQFEPIGAIAIGHPAADRPSSSLSRGRRPAAETIHRGHW